MANKALYNLSLKGFIVEGKKRNIHDFLQNLKCRIVKMDFTNVVLTLSKIQGDFVTFLLPS